MSIVINMNSYLVEILQNKYFNHFTISQLNDSYLSMAGEQCAIKTRKFVYREVIRLLRHNLLSKNGELYSHSSSYEKTDLFNHIEFVSKPLKNITDESINKNIITSELDNTLHKYKVDMMSAIGETEEYVRLFSSFPEMKNLLNKDYEKARDNSSKLLGKIKAVNTILSLQNSHRTNEAVEGISMAI